MVLHIFTFIYISYLTLPTQKKNRGEIRSPQSSGTTATSLRLCFHCDCVLHLVLRLLAIHLRPIIAFSIEFLSNSYRISIAFLSHRIAHFTSSHRTQRLSIGGVYPDLAHFYIDLSVMFVLIIFRSYRHCRHNNVVTLQHHFHPLPISSCCLPSLNPHVMGGH